MIKAVIFDYGAVLNRRLRLQKELYTLAADLRRRGIKTAVLSNISKPLTWPVKIRGDVKDFDPVAFSSEIGYNKPDPQAYQTVLDMLGFKPEECIFVDNRVKNTEAAETLGMQVVLARNTRQTADNIKMLIKD